ncbi:opacity protein-like surface antigen [Elusimicrobium posterum]|uniref:outer membrane beta-barrel protein n=1 Tax=Elusimicrobium posterum TaxID=3116653 RepID=UPI003C7656E4
MKKILFVLVLLASVNAFAGIDYGVDAGTTRIGVFGGMAHPQEWDFGGAIGDEDPGDTAPMFGVEFIRHVSPLMAVGFEFNYAEYGYNNIGAGMESKSTVFGGHVTGRVTFMSDKSTRVYIPFGLGLSRFEQKINPGWEKSQTGISMFGGAGVEFDMSPVWTVGVEGRYFYMPLDDDDFAEDFFGATSILFKVSARF